MDKLKAIANFVHIVNCGSLSAAAEATGQSVASVVRSLAALEHNLGVRLLNRNTRRMALTAEGEQYLQWSRRMLAEFDEIERSLESSDGTLRGKLRIAAPVEFGQRYITPLVNAFLQQHSAVSVELNLSDNIVPLLEERLDLALRIGHLPDSSMVARRVGSTRLITCASPAYLASATALETPAALQTHACITQSWQGRSWHYQDAGHAWVEQITPRLACNQIRAATLACTQGLGIARLMHYQVAQELADGQLVRVLRAYEPQELPIQLIYPHALQLSPRVRSFIEWVYPQLEQLLPNPDI